MGISSSDLFESLSGGYAVSTLFLANELARRSNASLGLPLPRHRPRACHSGRRRPSPARWARTRPPAASIRAVCRCPPPSGSTWLSSPMPAERDDGRQQSKKKSRACPVSEPCCRPSRPFSFEFSLTAFVLGDTLPRLKSAGNNPRAAVLEGCEL